MVDTKKVMIVILNYKTYNMTINLIKQLKKLNYDNFRVVVVDNCSPNESAKVLQNNAKLYDYDFIVNSVNSGYAAGNNLGIRFAIAKRFDYSWVMNNDVKITDFDILSKLVYEAEIREDVACVGPEIVDIDGYRTAPYVEKPSFWSLSLGVLSEKEKRQKYIGKSLYVYRVFGCCMLLKNSFMEAIDCMDERTFLYCEEDILAERLKKVNGCAYYTSNTSIIHLESMTVKKEHGRFSLGKVNIIRKSLDLYLKEYLKFNFIQRQICLFVRSMIVLIRG